MDGKDLLLRMIAFDRWANAEVTKTVAPLEGKLPRAVTLLAHVYRGWEAWLNRIRKIESNLVWFPELSLAEAETIRRDEEQRWDEFLASLTGDWSETKYQARLLSGTVGEFSLTEILLQLITHGVHHRGQINTLVREAGGEPVNPLYMSYAVASKEKPDI
jgi:uncharacterized damage-inducible protein DinB